MTDGIPKPGPGPHRRSQHQAQRRDSQPQERQSSPPRDSRADDFLNPYTFVPAYPRGRMPEPLSDGRPCGHDRLHDGRWTGSIAVTLTVQTPLLLPDTARAERAANVAEEHFVYPVLTRHGLPHLPVTSVKGMLRSAYEAITNSRLGIFEGHENHLGWRRVAADAQKMKPAFVTNMEGDRVEIKLYEAARLPAYVDDPVCYPDGKLPGHGQVVRARIGWQYSETKSGKPFKGPWTVRSIVRHGDGLPAEAPEWDDEEQQVVTGIVCVTGRNAVGKKHERLFFSRNEPRAFWVDGGSVKWARVMDSYRDAHKGEDLSEGRPEGPGQWLSDEPGKLAWSRHLWQQERAKLSRGLLCYAEVDDRKNPTRVLGLYPVMIPRDAAGRSPAEMLPDDLHPAPSIDDLSPADRLFGWVAPKGSGVRPAAFRGRLRIGPVTCNTAREQAVTRFSDDGLPLAILGQPKAGQGRFYLAKGPDTPEQPVPNGISKKELHLSDRRGLRGRKVYWHHAAIANNETYWREPSNGGNVDPTQEPIGSTGAFREFRRPRVVAGTDDDPALGPSRRSFKTKPGAEQRDNQNRSIRGWVNRATTFSFEVQVRDLDETELGALLWLLRLPPDCFHRLGLGKPLGFGSVRLDIDTSRTALHTADQYIEYYRSLSLPLPESDASNIIAAAVNRFDAVVNKSPALQQVRAAFLAAAQGTPNLPVHYPRARPKDMSDGAPMPPDPRGRSYEWFTANEKTSGERPAEGRGQSLPPAAERDPLRLYRADK